MDTEKLKKCSDCKCNKLLKYFKLRQNTGELYKTCMQCRDKRKKTRKKCKCGVRPSFGMITDKTPTCCVKCKSDDMVDITHKKCKCGLSQPSFGFINDKKPMCCSICKSDGMVNIKDKKCICGLRQPVFGMIGDKTATCCSICKSDDMVDIANKKCICGLHQPSFGLITDKFPTCCLNCKSDGMVNIKDKKCICGLSRPYFGMIGDKTATCCSICKLDDMVDITHKKCKSPMCDTRANQKYKEYCSRCFFFTFPDEPLTKNYKTKENSFIKPLHEKFSQYDHSHDKIIKHGCSLKRPDNITDFGSHVLVVEIDEGGHKNYECEMLRMMLILNDVQGRPTIFIRLNCDSYKIDGKRINSPFGLDKETGNLVIKNKKEFNMRLDKLFDTFDYYSKEREYKTFEMVELFY